MPAGSTGSESGIATIATATRTARSAARTGQGPRSMKKQELLDYLADPLNAFDLSETLWEEGGYGGFQTRWGEHDATGTAIAGVPGEYKELMIQLPGSHVYSTGGHLPGISNPIVQIRFHITTAEDALWWAMTTITTVGYGDRYPTTTEGRLVAVGLMAVGVGLFGTLSGLAASWFTQPER